ncbi:hypothetical protein GYA49_00530 [Candidatus Beckwithbacteria bacterium]|nr:hypothetical protein [Candidatus Beckwithbacteria bacterium]
MSIAERLSPPIQVGDRTIAEEEMIERAKLDQGILEWVTGLYRSGESLENMYALGLDRTEYTVSLCATNEQGYIIPFRQNDDSIESSTIKARLEIAERGKPVTIAIGINNGQVTVLNPETRKPDSYTAVFAGQHNKVVGQTLELAGNTYTREKILQFIDLSDGLVCPNTQVKELEPIVDHNLLEVDGFVRRSEALRELNESHPLLIQFLVGRIVSYLQQNNIQGEALANKPIFELLSILPPEAIIPHFRCGYRLPQKKVQNWIENLTSRINDDLGQIEKRNKVRALLGTLNILVASMVITNACRITNFPLELSSAASVTSAATLYFLMLESRSQNSLETTRNYCEQMQRIIDQLKSFQ